MKTTRREALVGLFGAVAGAFVITKAPPRMIISAPRQNPVSWQSLKEPGVMWVNSKVMVRNPFNKDHVCGARCHPGGVYDPHACATERCMEQEDKVWYEFAAKAMVEWKATHV